MPTTHQEHQLNYEELGAAAAKLDHAAVEKAASAMSAPTAAGLVPPQICNLYGKVKPFLKLIASIPFIPGSIKAAISAFMAGMNLICP
ncbi:hypothetical protein E4631_04695 [Hymenobacter sp. UV11]|uniref:hypothetical protein n=1 Tax=Hymenobacter sp. UV11 TaxID=1849735 RepID=UPI00105E364D|nr:hypothetical protein [Hymenobacter sp. UV11]TFZ68293.1 hypothetical protein E4631_04695 [Hymenobacter sp. UV11]